MDPEKPNLIALGEFAAYEGLFESVSTACSIVRLRYAQYEVGDPFTMPPALVLCSVPPEGTATIELAQSLRMHYPDLPIYYVLETREGFDRPAFIKNGFTDAFMLPNDREFLETTIKRDIANASHGALRVFREVQLIDIEVGATLGFDLYLHLPANNRHVKIVSARDPLDEGKAARLLKHNINSASVTQEQISSFYKFSADRLRSLGKSDALSESEKVERRENAVRALLTGIFSQTNQIDSLEKGRGIMEDCSEIVKSYIIGDSKNSWYERFLKVSSAATGTYNHAANVSTLACLLAIGIGITEVEEIGLAGLLHDIGTADLPPEVCGKTQAERTPDENKIYESHPQKSVDMIKAKKIIVSPKVMNIILQHHEQYDGTGYPAKMAGDRILIEAQLLRVADEIEKLTTVVATRARVTMLEAVKTILGPQANAPGRAMISPELSRKILTLLPTEGGA